MANTTERVLRFDTVVAICALLISTITAGAMVYQTRVLEQQFAAANWPYLSVNNDATPASFSIGVTNNGAGPALIRSAQLTLDGKTVEDWSPLLQSAIRAGETSRPHGHLSFSADSTSIDASVTLRPGDSRTLIAMSRAPARVIDDIRSHRILLNFCYCSLTDKCWHVSDHVGSLGVDLPQPVRACEIGSTIGALNIK